MRDDLEGRLVRFLGTHYQIKPTVKGTARRLAKWDLCMRTCVPVRGNRRESISHFLLCKGMISEGNNKSSCMCIRDYVLFHRTFLRDFQAGVEIQVRDCTVYLRAAGKQPCFSYHLLESLSFTLTAPRAGF